MPRNEGSKLRAEVVSVPTALIASAVQVSKLPDLEKRLNPLIKIEDWQRIAWTWFDEIGEYRYSVNWVGNLLSKASLVVTKDGKPTTDQGAVDALASLYGGNHAEMLRQFGIHLTVAGECYIIGTSNAADDGDDWLVAAATEVKSAQGNDTTWKVDDEEFADPLVIRLWRPHPRKRKYSDSPTRAVLPILAEIDGLTKHVSAQIDSRLASAGILFIPNEMNFGSTTATGASLDPNAVVARLIEVASTAIANRADASALVPIVAQGPGEHLDKIKHLTFWTELDKAAIELRQEAIRRLALGMDMPPEVLTGTAEMNHWNAWQVEEAAIKAHTEPLLETIASSLTEGYLRPLLMSDDEDTDGLELDEANRYAIEVDTSKLRLRPNRSKEAIELYDRGELSAEALLRENGFDPEDSMEDEEFRRWIVKRVSGGSTTPELVDAAIRELGVVLDVAESAEPTEEARPDRSLIEHPEQGPPEVPEDAVTAAGWVMVFRALERAGNRLRTKMGAKIAGVSAFDTYQFVEIEMTEGNLDFLLADAWSPVAELAPALGITDAEAFADKLDGFTRDLLVMRRPLKHYELARFLEQDEAEQKAA